MKVTTGSVRVIGLAACAMVLACEAASERESGDGPNAAVGHASDTLQPVAEHQHSPAAGPLEELEAMDRRTPVPLLPMMAWHQKQNMMQHLVVIERIIAATAERDWTKVAEVARGIEASESERRSCEKMGAGASGFTQLALEFHDRAAAIGRAAALQSTEQVLLATSHTVSACTSCHAQYRQQLVDLETWSRLEAATEESPHGHARPHP